MGMAGAERGQAEGGSATPSRTGETRKGGTVSGKGYQMAATRMGSTCAMPDWQQRTQQLLTRDA